MKLTKPLLLAAMLSVSLGGTVGCKAVDDAKYGTLEKFGIHKRDILVDRVTDTRDAQKESQEQFQTALEKLSELISFDGGQLQEVYEALQDQYDASQEAADRLTGRIDKVEKVAQDLFTEWETELQEYSSERLRRDSRKKLQSTERKYQKMLRAMRQAESKMEPVLTALKDNTLYLKHNLNAQAIGAIKAEYDRIKADVGALIEEMNAAIAESDAFIKDMEQPTT